MDSKQSTTFHTPTKRSHYQSQSPSTTKTMMALSSPSANRRRSYDISPLKVAKNNRSPLHRQIAPSTGQDLTPLSRQVSLLRSGDLVSLDNEGRLNMQVSYIPTNQIESPKKKIHGFSSDRSSS